MYYFFWFHTLIQPFKEQKSNYIEALSLMFIALTSSISLLKSSLIYSGIILHHYLSLILGFLGNAEHIFLRMYVPSTLNNKDFKKTYFFERPCPSYLKNTRKRYSLCTVFLLWLTENKAFWAYCRPNLYRLI